MATAEREEENEVILFQRPDHVLFVWGLPESLSWESKWSQLVEAFRIYGLLHAVHVPPDEKQVCYAFIKYYSSKASNRALLNTDKQLSIGGSLLKVNGFTELNIGTINIIFRSSFLTLSPPCSSSKQVILSIFQNAMN